VLALRKEIAEQEKILAEAKAKSSSINTVVIEVKKLKALHHQMADQLQKTYALLSQEFEGAPPLLY